MTTFCNSRNSKYIRQSSTNAEFPPVINAPIPENGTPKDLWTNISHGFDLCTDLCSVIYAGFSLRSVFVYYDTYLLKINKQNVKFGRVLSLPHLPASRRSRLDHLYPQGRQHFPNHQSECSAGPSIDERINRSTQKYKNRCDQFDLCGQKTWMETLQQSNSPHGNPAHGKTRYHNWQRFGEFYLMNGYTSLTDPSLQRRDNF